MSKLSKIANHPELIKLDSKYRDDEDKVADCKRFCTLAHGVEPSSIIRTTRWKDLRDETQAGKLGALHGLLDRFDRESPPAKVLIFSLPHKPWTSSKARSRPSTPTPCGLTAPRQCSKTKKRRQI